MLARRGRLRARPASMARGCANRSRTGTIGSQRVTDEGSSSIRSWASRALEAPAPHRRVLHLSWGPRARRGGGASSMPRCAPGPTGSPPAPPAGIRGALAPVMAEIFNVLTPRPPWRPAALRRDGFGRCSQRGLFARLGTAVYRSPPRGLRRTVLDGCQSAPSSRRFQQFHVARCRNRSAGGTIQPAVAIVQQFRSVHEPPGVPSPGSRDLCPRTRDGTRGPRPESVTPATLLSAGSEAAGGFEQSCGQA